MSKAGRSSQLKFDQLQRGTITGMIRDSHWRTFHANKWGRFGISKKPEAYCKKEFH